MIIYHGGIIQLSHKGNNSGFYLIHDPRQLATFLQQQGHQVSHQLVAELLRANGYSLQSNAKTWERTQHPERDAQFHYLNKQTKQFLQQGLPVVSVDTKKKELVGDSKILDSNGSLKDNPLR
jgi:hypothetical protein